MSSKGPSQLNLLCGSITLSLVLGADIKVLAVGGCKDGFGEKRPLCQTQTVPDGSNRGGKEGGGGRGGGSAPRQSRYSLLPVRTCAREDENCERKGVSERNCYVMTVTAPLAPLFSLLKGLSVTCGG